MRREVSPQWEDVVDMMDNEALKLRLRQDSTMSISSVVMGRRPSLDVAWDAMREHRDTGTFSRLFCFTHVFCQRI